MHENIKISDSEMEVMQVFWSEENNWLSLNDLCAALAHKDWKYNTIGTFVLRLTEKGALKAKKEGKTNYYYPIISKDEYKKMETKQFLNEVHGGSMKSLIASLYDESLNETAITELMEWLNNQ